MRGMKKRAADGWELIKIYIVANHCRAIDDHWTTMNDMETIADLRIPLYANLMANINPTGKQPSCLPPITYCCISTTATKRGSGTQRLKSQPSTYVWGCHCFCPLCGSSRCGYSQHTLYSSWFSWSASFMIFSQSCEERKDYAKDF